MCCCWAKRSVLAACLALLLGQTAASSAEEAEYLDIWSKGYSRFEIDDGDVVAFFTGGVEFDYVGFRASSQELRYNHATKAATASGNVELELDGSTARCTVLDLDAHTGTAVLAGNVKMVVLAEGLLGPNGAPPGEVSLVPEHDDTGAVTNTPRVLKLACSRAVLSFPPGDLDLRDSRLVLSDMDLRLIGPVTISDDSGRCLRCAAASFDHHRMVLEVPGSFVFEGGPQPLTENLAADLTSDAVVSGSALSLQLEQDGGLSAIRCLGIEVTTAGLQAQLADMQAADLAPSDSCPRWRQYEVLTSSAAGELLDANQAPVRFSVLDLTVRAAADGTATASIGGAIVVDSAAGAFRADTLVATVLSDGSVELHEPFTAMFDLASLSGMESASLLSAGSPRQ